jgi:hypothetical protein
MILKMRALPPKTSPRPDTGVLKTTKDESDDNAVRWFDMINVTRKCNAYAGFVRDALTI